MNFLAGVKEFTEMRREEGEAELGLAAFLGQISLATDQDSDDATEERVTLMTVHAAKRFGIQQCVYRRCGGGSFSVVDGARFAERD